jgi:hypothetical protein
MLEQTQQQHKHDIIYYGVVNLINDGNVIGAIDVWRCRGCPDIFCEDKRYGIMDLAAEVGFPKIEPGAKWAALICTKEKASDWTLTGAKPGNIIHHSCTPDTKVDLTVGPDYTIMAGMASGIGRHRIIILENFVNSAVDVVTGKPHSGPTNANQAPGRPFSFAPEHSAALVEKSIYNIYNLTSVAFFASAISTGYAGISFDTGIVSRIVLLLAVITGIAGGYFTINRRNIGPLLGLGTGVLGIIGLATTGLIGRGLGVDVLSVLLLATLALGWISRTRIKKLSEQQWHPLDMPAYG